MPFSRQDEKLAALQRRLDEVIAMHQQAADDNESLRVSSQLLCAMVSDLPQPEGSVLAHAHAFADGCMPCYHGAAVASCRLLRFHAKAKPVQMTTMVPPPGAGSEWRYGD